MTDPNVERTVQVALQKGGTAKTTLAVSLGTEAARLGARVLLVDLDPNWGLTGDHLGYDPAPGGDLTTGDLILRGSRQGAAAEALLNVPAAFQLRNDLPWDQGGAMPGGALAFIPGYPTLQGAVESTMASPASETFLRRALSGVASEFDLVILDTGPRADRIAWMAMQASSHVLGAAIPEDGAVKGVAEQIEFVASYADLYGLPIRLAGVVCTKFDGRNSVAHSVGLDRLREALDASPSGPVTNVRTHTATSDFPTDVTSGAVLWDEVIPQSTAVLHAQNNRQPISAGLLPTGETAWFERKRREKALAVVLPYTRAAIRLLRVMDSPALSTVAENLRAAPIDGLWEPPKSNRNREGVSA